jgi:hypothetical protein
MQWQSDLVVSLSKVSATSDPQQARAVLREALAIVERLARDGKLTASQLLSLVPAQQRAATTQTPRRPMGAGGGEERAGLARCPRPPQTLSLR